MSADEGATHLIWLRLMSWLLLASRYGRTCVVMSTIEKANIEATI